jgi:hypothetical protein
LVGYRLSELYQLCSFHLLLAAQIPIFFTYFAL